jgi:hypothetical protein
VGPDVNKNKKERPPSAPVLIEKSTLLYVNE